VKRVLIVGYDFNYVNDLNAKYKDCLFIPAGDIEHDSATRLIELVGIADEVLFVGERYIGFEIAAVMLKKEISTKADYPVGEKTDLTI